MTSRPHGCPSPSSSSSPSLLFVDGDAKTWTNATPLTPRNLVASEPCAGGTYTVGIARRRESASVFELDGLDLHVERLCNDAAVAHNFAHSTRGNATTLSRRSALEEAVRTNLDCALASASISTSEAWERAREATVTDWGWSGFERRRVGATESRRAVERGEETQSGSVRQRLDAATRTVSAGSKSGAR